MPPTAILGAIKIDPINATFREALGEVYSASGQTDEAIAEFQRAIELDPDNVAAHSWLGYEFKGQADIDKAITELQRAIECNP